MAYLDLAQFVAEFVVPLHAGGAVRVRPPIPTSQVERFRMQGSELAATSLRQARLRSARRLLADPPLGDADHHDVAFWVSLHNTLFFDHPDTGRVWARSVRWRGLERETRRLIDWARPVELGDALSRHIALASMLSLTREDHIIATVEGDMRFAGQPMPRRGLWLVGARGEPRTEVVSWVSQAHAPAVARLYAAMLSVSPLTGLLHPEHAGVGWSALSAVPFFKVRSIARAICHSWARSGDWIAAGGAITGNVLRALGIMLPPAEARPGVAFSVDSLPSTGSNHISRGAPQRPQVRDKARPLPEAARPSAALPASAADVGLLIAALIHLHVLKVFEVDARISTVGGMRDPNTAAFLGLPLLLDRIAPVIGDPNISQAQGADPSLHQRWLEYLEHLRGVVPRTINDDILGALARRLTEKTTA